MTTLLEPETRRASTSTTTPAQRLRTTMAAVRVSFTWMGTRKSLSHEQKAQAAETFDAEGQFLSAGKKLIDTRHEAFRAVTSIRGKIASYWKGLSLPFPEPGVRLIKQDQVEAFVAQLADFKTELDDAVANLNQHYRELKSAAAARLGSLYNPADYPETLIGLFGVAWEFPSVEPPEYLMRLNPGLYDQERARVSARFDEAVALAEQAFMEELARLVAHLTERITDAQGEGKVFRDTAVNNLREFFDRFRSLNVRSNAELEQLVAQAQHALRGTGPQALRNSTQLRQEVAGQLARVTASLDTLLAERPRRRILRQTVAPEGS
jgi:hypothetical protein